MDMVYLTTFMVAVTQQSWWRDVTAIVTVAMNHRLIFTTRVEKNHEFGANYFTALIAVCDSQMKISTFHSGWACPRCCNSGKCRHALHR